MFVKALENNFKKSSLLVVSTLRNTSQHKATRLVSQLPTIRNLITPIRHRSLHTHQRSLLAQIASNRTQSTMAQTADVDKVARLLIESQLSGGNAKIEPGQFSQVDRDAAYKIMAVVQKALGEETGMYKTAIHPDGVGVAAPIYKSRIGQSPDFSFPGDKLNTEGLEFEVGVKLAKDIPAGADKTTIAAAVDHYYLGIEIVGRRITATAEVPKAPPPHGLADNMSALGYVIGRVYDREPTVDDVPVSFEVDGKVIDRRPAKCPFEGGMLATLVAYAKSQQPHLLLKAGMLITLGSVNGCVPLPQGTKGRVVGTLGDETPVEFTIR
ncbi:uncharacterized protein PgNI_11928 [Pyricularia grisea]|uniref:Fumarylacetoacetase-like C-terminal domain-containing protein n=1 Tax=Pyricularia grisea TaxID=148305 RepID=A0A6P8AR01_PYRGI|nr:uncharacterized protein PgNI_11928 [Pyricularia grisea]TLD04479.1 hypothetical protein PgNI_11928 [Pyricularia grisea]